MKKLIKFKPMQFSKIAIINILVFAMIWISYSYILATIALFTYQDSNVLETLSIEVCRTIIFCMLGYFCKSYFETYSEEKNKLTLQLNNEEESVG